jgi:hypothetical protein
MSNALLTDICELNLSRLPNEFTLQELEASASEILTDLDSHLGVNRILQCTRLRHAFRTCILTDGNAGINIAIGLGLKDRTLLDNRHGGATIGTLEQLILQDREALISALKNLPMVYNAAFVELAQRISAAALDIEVGVVSPDFSARLKLLVSSKLKKFRGTVAGNHLQMDLPEVPRYVWHKDTIQIRVVLEREKSGFTVKLLGLRGPQHPLHAVRQLRMP